jgi:hypothetical protein
MRITVVALEWHERSRGFSTRDGVPLVRHCEAQSQVMWMWIINEDVRYKGQREDGYEQERVHLEVTESAVEATSLGLKTKSGLRPNSPKQGGLYTC